MFSTPRFRKLSIRHTAPGQAEHCAPVSSKRRAALLTEVRAHLTAAESSQLVIGYTLTDDYMIDMSDSLRAVADAIHVAGHRPAVCAMALPLNYLARGRESVIINRTVFQRALRNYSPAWCDAIVIYAYGPIQLRTTVETVDWSMQSILGPALSDLRSRGWQPDRAPLIGAPQAFGFAPRISAPGRSLNRPQWAPTPTRQDLRSQIDAFCAAGAQSILAYAWRDGSSGAINELGNSGELRAGLSDGAADCRSRHWDAEQGEPAGSPSETATTSGQRGG